VGLTYWKYGILPQLMASVPISIPIAIAGFAFPSVSSGGPGLSRTGCFARFYTLRTVVIRIVAGLDLESMAFFQLAAAGFYKYSA
jgi:hypothetical protein